MSKKILSVLQYIIFLGLGIGLVWWQLKSMTPSEKNEFYSSLEKANYIYAIPVVIMSLLSHLSRAMRWKLLLKPLGFNPALKNLFAVTIIGYLANSAVPRLGEILKCTFLSKYEKLPVDKLVGSIILERIFDLLCFVVFIAISILIQINLVGNFFKDEFQKVTSSGSLNSLIIKTILLIIFLAFLFLLIKKISQRFPDNFIIRKIKNFISGIYSGITAILKIQNKAAFLGHTIFIWAMYLLQIYVGFSAMESTSHLSLNAAFSVLTLATVAMIITPGGIGSFPILVMETLVIYGIAQPYGKAFGWLLWGANTMIYIIFGVLSLILLPYINRNKNENKQGHITTENF